MKTFPKLYKKTNTGAIQQWTIGVSVDVDYPPEEQHGLIWTEHGQVDGKLQTTSDTITEGKNVGRSNETTPVEQALAEAKAKWTKQKKKGYVESVVAAMADEVDEVIEGGILPMLAPNKSYPKDDELQKRIVFPCFFQPKLDGMRCIAIVEDGVCEIWSRTRKRINTVPHIVEALEKQFPIGRIVWDGELYNHEFKDRFEDLLSILRGDEPDEEGEYLQAEYHVYDCLEQNLLDTPHTMESSFEDRNRSINCFMFKSDSPIKRVKTTQVNDLVELNSEYEAALVDGYEGGMARNRIAKYESGKRSKNLQKMKEFQDAEFEIIGAEDGRGKDAGTVAKFVCVTKEGKEFRPRLKATYTRRRELMKDPSQWKGKILTVTFKRWTSDNVPYIPIGKAIRDYE